MLNDVDNREYQPLHQLVEVVNEESFSINKL